MGGDFPKIKVALLDMYDGTENLGIPSLIHIVSQFDELELDSYDVRQKCEVPGVDYDIYLFSGGPGSPIASGGELWERSFFFLMDKLWYHNQRYDQKKYAFFICHSFQMACYHLGIGSVVKRRKPSYGIFPVFKTDEGKKDPLLGSLPNPFYAADFRRWQVIDPNKERIEYLGCKILAREKLRPQTILQRALMAVRFSDEWIGTQFHPEANPDGMLAHFDKSIHKNKFIGDRGIRRYERMMRRAKNPDMLRVTYETVIPGFLRDSIAKIKANNRMPEKVK